MEGLGKVEGMPRESVLWEVLGEVQPCSCMGEE